MIVIGTSGYSFDDWVGPFYPSWVSRSDRLAYYTRHFPVVEINSTYYGIPQARVFHQMERKTPDGFEFLVKLHASQTHARAGHVESTAALIDSVTPLIEKEKFGGFLAQFPWAFQAQRPNAVYLLELRKLIPPELPFYVEFRHASWIEEKTFDWLAKIGVGYCSVDEPQLKGLVPPVVRATGAPGYVRFHGRNAENWWGRGRGDRYDYTYTEDELREWVRKIRDLEQETGKVYLFFNNCHHAQAVEGAKMMSELLAG